MTELCQIAQLAAKEAGSLIQKYRSESPNIKEKEGGNTLASQVVTAADFASQEIILKYLNPTLSRFDLGLLSEELNDDQSRLTKDYHWCIDPLDGTLPYTESKTGYAISIALLDKAGVSHIGVVFDPPSDNLYSAIRGQGAFKNNKALSISKNKENEAVFTFITDRSFLNHVKYNKISRFIKQLSVHRHCNTTNVISHGGAVMNALWLLDHHPAVYFKFPKEALGGGSVWDYAATACIFEALNLRPTDCFGKNLIFNNPHNTFMNLGGIVYATDQSLQQEVVAFYREEFC